MRLAAVIVALVSLALPAAAPAAKGCKEKHRRQDPACHPAPVAPEPDPQAPGPGPAVTAPPVTTSPATTTPATPGSQPQLQSQPALPAAVDPAALMPALPAQRPSVSRSGKVALRLRCPQESAGGCAGTVTLSIPRARRARRGASAKAAAVAGARVGRRRFRLAPGASRRVAVRLSRQALRRLHRRHKLAVTVAVTVKAGGRTATSTRRVMVLDRRTAAHRPSRKKHKRKRRRRR